MDPAELSRDCRAAAALLKSMANEHRLAILCRLAIGEMPVNELVEAIGLGQSALSQHLAVLRAEGLVSTRRASQQIFYSLASPKAQRVMETLHDLYCAGPASPPLSPRSKEDRS